jgi:hypothetical protein
MKSQRKIVVFALTLSLCVITRIALGMCQYEISISVQGTLADCSSGCSESSYQPAITGCTNTCDTLTCRNTGDTQETTIYTGYGTCSGGRCIDQKNIVSPGSIVPVYVSDDGCTTPCGG